MSFTNEDTTCCGASPRLHQPRDSSSIRPLCRRFFGMCRTIQDIDRVLGELTMRLVVWSSVFVQLVIKVAFFQFRRQPAAECQEPTGAVCAGHLIMRRVRGNVQAKKCANLYRPREKVGRKTPPLRSALLPRASAGPGRPHARKKLQCPLPLCLPHHHSCWNQRPSGWLYHLAGPGHFGGNCGMRAESDGDRHTHPYWPCTFHDSGFP